LDEPLEGVAKLHGVQRSEGKTRSINVVPGRERIIQNDARALFTLWYHPRRRYLQMGKVLHGGERENTPIAFLRHVPHVF
jgi:hypothetical protein